MIRFPRLLVVIALVWLWITPVALADDVPTPPPVTSPVVVEPTAPAPEQVPAPEPVPTAATQPVPVSVPTPQPVQVTRESGGSVKVNNPGVSSETPPAPVPVTVLATPTSRGSASISTTTSPSAPVLTGPSSRPGPPPDTAQTDSTSSVDSSSISTAVIQSQASAQAPAQLKCTGKGKPVSDPFMVAPYQGWTELVSFVDHDDPDYAVDGRIVIANGLAASAAQGQESDFFPSYWSPELRQYINYDGHNGYDFGLSYQPVLAAGSGTVKYAGWNGGPYDGYGQMILIDHHNGYSTLYGHLSTLDVQTGDTVTAGQEIGISGSTGRSSGPHLHFSVFHNCNVTDPYGWTGDAPDPLRDFNNERASYLWLPGHDPLVVNPPPNWPQYPVGLAIAPSARKVAAISRSLPSTDRLLLLALPRPEGRSVSAGVALARTESLMSEEYSRLVPYLQDLEREGLVDTFRFMPASAAIWVRGTASSQQLEALPGVASLSGVRVRDLGAAQQGLAHAVLIQEGVQQAPSLWPSGFRSAIHTWRPMISSSIGQSMITGIGVPGQPVTVTLLRSGKESASAQARGDAETGDFLAVLHDPSGQLLPVQPGDTLVLTQANRVAMTRIKPISIQPADRSVGSGPTAIHGSGSPAAQVAVAAVGDDGSIVARTSATLDANGRYAAILHTTLSPGTLLVSTSTDSSGSRQSATTYVPGLRVMQDSATIAGWISSSVAHVRVSRGSLHLSQTATADASGRFELELTHAGRPFVLLPGDALSIQDGSTTTWVTIPTASGRWTSRSAQVQIHESGHANALVVGAGVRRFLNLQKGGNGSFKWSGAQPENAHILLSPRVDLVIPLRSESLQIAQKSGKVVGATAPGASVSITLLDGQGRFVGEAVVAGRLGTGRVSTSLADGMGNPLQLRAGMSIIMRGQRTEIIRIPDVTANLDARRSTILLTRPKATAVYLTFLGTGGHLLTKMDVPRGSDTVSIPHSLSGRIKHVSVSFALGAGLTMERSLAFAPARGNPHSVAKSDGAHTHHR